MHTAVEWEGITRINAKLLYVYVVNETRYEITMTYLFGKYWVKYCQLVVCITYIDLPIDFQ